MTTELCDCGRPLQPKHCPFCGALNLYGRAKSGRVDTVRDGATGKTVVLRIKGFACRRCGENFADDVPCKAPEKAQRGASRAEIQAARAALERDSGHAGHSAIFDPSDTDAKVDFLFRLANQSAIVRKRYEAQGVDFGAPADKVHAAIAATLATPASDSEAGVADSLEDADEAIDTKPTLAGHARGSYTGGVLEEQDNAQVPLGSTEPLESETPKEEK